MSRSLNNLIVRFLVDVFVIFLMYGEPWYLAVGAIAIFALFFFPYFEMIVFGGILDAYYGNSNHYQFTIIVSIYFIIIFLLQNRLLINNYVSIPKKKV